MSDALLTVGLVLSGILLAYTTYAALYGLAGAFTGRSYERCPHCHRHYLSDGSGIDAHQCAPGWDERMHHAFHSVASHAHHAHAGRG